EWARASRPGLRPVVRAPMRAHLEEPASNPPVRLSEVFSGRLADYAGAATLGCAVIATRIPLAGRYLFDWDSLQFALGMQRFNLASHRPHPPGYVGYIVLGRALVRLTGLPADTVMVTVSAVAEALTVATIFLIARRVFGSFAAWAGALLLLTSPLYWLYGETALT